MPLSVTCGYVLKFQVVQTTLVALPGNFQVKKKLVCTTWKVPDENFDPIYIGKKLPFWKNDGEEKGWKSYLKLSCNPNLINYSN